MSEVLIFPDYKQVINMTVVYKICEKGGTYDEEVRKEKRLESGDSNGICLQLHGCV